MAYGISLSGLSSAQEAIDVTSNNIANAQTIGYKSGEYVFADQFFRATDPQNKDRAGMGAYRQGIRRNDNYGTIVNSANTLDMAVTGKGMFIVAKSVDGTVPTENPTKFQYTRNGQFGVDSEGRVVNQSGMFLVGYPADSTGLVNYGTKSVLILNPTETLPQKATQNSTVNLNLDDRVSTITGNAFSPTKPTTYSQSTSQTVYDSLGDSHTLSLYYKKVSSADLIMTGTGVTGTTFTFDPTQSLGTIMAGEQSSRIATTAVASTVAGSAETISDASLKFISGGKESSTGVSELEMSESGDGYTDGVYRNVNLTSLTGGISGVDSTSAASGLSYINHDFDGGTYDNDGIYTSVPLSSLYGSGSGAKGTLKVENGVITSFEITSKGSGYLPGDDLYIEAADAYSAGMLDSDASSSLFSATALGYSTGMNYRDGTYKVSLDSNSTYGDGTAKATIEVTDGKVSSFTTNLAGTGYQVGDYLNSTSATWTDTDGNPIVARTANVTTGTQGESGVAEVATATFQDLAEGETVVLAGVTFTAGVGGATAANVAAAFASLTDTTTYSSDVVTGGTRTGTVSGWDTGVSSGSSPYTVTFTASSTGAQSNLQTDFQTVITKIKTNGNGALGTVVVKNGAVDSVTVTQGGIGYAEGDYITIGTSDVGGGTAVTKFKASVTSLLSPSADQPESGGVDTANTSTTSSLFTAGSGYSSGDGTFYNVPLSTDGSGSGALATIVIEGGEVSKVLITSAGTGYASGDSLYVSDSDTQDAGMDSGTPTERFSTVVSSLVTTGSGTQGSTYSLTLNDGTILSVKQTTTSESGDFQFSVNADRFAVYATLDGNAVAQDASASNPATVNIGGVDTEEQISLGTMAFIGGKNIDSLAQDAFGTPQFNSRFTIDASGGEGTGFGQTINGGVVQLTLDSTKMTGYSSTAMTYDNTQDGHATAYIASYNVDAYGKLVATFDNGAQLTKGRVALAYFSNFEGLVPTGDNLFLASSASGEAETGEYANEGVLGAIRSKALESSNVDLTSELVKLMVLQRHYSAVSQAAKIQVATLVDEALNIGR